MKGLDFTTILLVFVLINIIISICLIAFAMFKLSKAPEYEVDKDQKITKEGLSAAKYWKARKMLLVTPTIMNVANMMVIGVLFVMR